MLCRLIRRNRTDRKPIGALITSYLKGPVDLGQAPSPDLDLPGEDAVSELIGRLVAGKDEDADREFARLSALLEPSSLIERVIGPPWSKRAKGGFATRTRSTTSG